MLVDVILWPRGMVNLLLCSSSCRYIDLLSLGLLHMVVSAAWRDRQLGSSTYFGAVQSEVRREGGGHAGLAGEGPESLQRSTSFVLRSSKNARVFPAY